MYIIFRWRFLRTEVIGVCVYNEFQRLEFQPLGYGIPMGLFFSFPVTIDPMNKEWKIVQGLSLDEFAKSKIDTTTQVGSSPDG